MLVASLLALLFPGFTLGARGRARRPELRQQRRAAMKENRRLERDMIHARRAHAAEIPKLSGELESLRGGRGRG